jgi:hypothetical protein
VTVLLDLYEHKVLGFDSHRSMGEIVFYL